MVGLVSVFKRVDLHFHKVLSLLSKHFKQVKMQKLLLDSQIS